MSTWFRKQRIKEMKGYQVSLKGYEVVASFPSEMQEKLADVAREANEAGYDGDEVECDYKLVDFCNLFI